MGVAADGHAPANFAENWLMADHSLVMRKLLAVKWRRMQKAPEVQQRFKTISAAASQIQDTVALPNKLAKSTVMH